MATDIRMPQPAIYTPGPSNPPSTRSSLLLPTHKGELFTGVYNDFDGYESPPPVDERTAQTKNERRYRLLLTHEYNASRMFIVIYPLTVFLPLLSVVLPLWSPTPVELGAVGYLSKPRGEFITLFNAYSPVTSSHPAIQVLPSIDGYGRTPTNFQRTDRRTVWQKVWDPLGGSLSFGNISYVHQPPCTVRNLRDTRQGKSSPKIHISFEIRT